MKSQTGKCPIDMTAGDEMATKRGRNMPYTDKKHASSRWGLRGKGAKTKSLFINFTSRFYDIRKWRCELKCTEMIWDVHMYL